MKTVAALSCLTMLMTTADAQTIIYDTFNEDDQAALFDSIDSVQIGAKRTRDRASASVPFKVPVKTRITEIDLPLFYAQASRGRAVEVDVVGEHGTKHGFRVLAHGPGSPCCTFVAIHMKGVAVAPGVDYSILVYADSRINGGWNLNSAGFVGPFTTWDVDGQHEHMGTLPAMRIFGE